MNIQKFNNLEKVNSDRRGFLKAVCSRVVYVEIGSFALTHQDSYFDVSSPASLSGSGINIASDIKLDISLLEKSTLQIVDGCIGIKGNDIDADGCIIFRLGDKSVLAYNRACTH